MSRQIYLEKSLAKPRPFLKWAGGKSQMLDQFEELFPKDYNNYLEPMVGAAAVFFHLYTTGRLKNKSVLIDINQELLNCYEVIRDNVEELITSLKKLRKRYKRQTEEAYYQIRKWDRKEDFVKRSKVEKAARTIFLNKVCYNGLYRVNGNRQFNTPIGRYKNPTICDEENLQIVKVALQKAELLTTDFEKSLEIASSGDFVYFDPPYYPLSKTANFTSYTEQDFTEDDQKRLKDTFEKLAEKGCKVMLSNSDTKFIRDLYKKFNIHTVYAKRYINSNSEGRGVIAEIVVTNY